MAFFGRKKKKKNGEKNEAAKGNEPKKKKKIGKSRRKPSVVSTRARVGGVAGPRNPSSTLRRRTTSRGPRRQIRPHFIVDPTTKKLVQVNLPTHVTGGLKGYSRADQQGAGPQEDDGEVDRAYQRQNDKMDLERAVLRHPASVHRRREGGRKKDVIAAEQPPPPPAPPPPLIKSPRGKKGLNRKKSWAEDPSDLGPSDLTDSTIPRKSSLQRRSGAVGHKTSMSKNVIRNPKSRQRTSEDLKEWLFWRMQVNEQLTSFVLRDRNDPNDSLPVGAFPRTLKEERLNAIFEHAKTNETPKTSLDNLSYMIYGIPRVRHQPFKCNQRQTQVIIEGCRRTPSPDYDEQDQGGISDKSCWSRGSADTMNKANTHELTASTVLSESDQHPSPPHLRGQGKQGHGDRRRNGQCGSSPDSAPPNSQPRRSYRLDDHRAMRSPPPAYPGHHHRSQSPIYQNVHVAGDSPHPHRAKYGRPRKSHHQQPPPPRAGGASHGLRPPTRDPSSSGSSQTGRPGTPGTMPQFSKPPIPGAVPTVLSLCSLQHVSSQRELRHVPSQQRRSRRNRSPSTDTRHNASPRRHLHGPNFHCEQPPRHRPHQQSGIPDQAHKHYRHEGPSKS